MPDNHYGDLSQWPQKQITQTHIPSWVFQLPLEFTQIDTNLPVLSHCSFHSCWEFRFPFGTFSWLLTLGSGARAACTRISLQKLFWSSPFRDESAIGSCNSWIAGQDTSNLCFCLGKHTPPGSVSRSSSALGILEPLLFQYTHVMSWIPLIFPAAVLLLNTIWSATKHCLPPF